LGRKLHPSLIFANAILHLKFTAPAFDFEVVENLAHDSAKETFQVCVVEIREAADCCLLVCLEQKHTLLISFDFVGKLTDFVNGEILQVFMTPERFEKGFFVTPGALPSDGKQNTRTHLLKLVFSGIFAEVIHVIANLVGDSEILRILREHITDLIEFTSVAGA
jgi:hypothetical protein